MKYIKLVLAVEEAYQETLIAELMDLGFDEFQQMEAELITYIPESQFYISDRERIEHLLANYPGEGYIKSEEIVKDQNWNEEWEKTIQAQSIGPFLVKPTWSPAVAEPDQILLEIDPKMAFGTGYHETTRLMLRQMPKINFENAMVLDAGTGSGILAIAAAKLGAFHVHAFDIDGWSITNALENIYLNGVEQLITIKKGTHTVIDQQKRFDVILANIHLNVIYELVPFFALHLKDEGNILLSGLLQFDEDKIRKRLALSNLNYIETLQENEWIAIRARK